LEVRDRDDLHWLQDWLATIREATNKGRRFSSVWVNSLPHTDDSEPLRT
jgi:hypothetical protein